MKFIVDRTTTRFRNPYRQPIAEAVRESVTMPDYKGGERTEDRWVVQIDDIDTVVSFVARYGELVFEEHDAQGIDGYIEIYDDYRE